MVGRSSEHEEDQQDDDVLSAKFDRGRCWPTFKATLALMFSKIKGECCRTFSIQNAKPECDVSERQIGISDRRRLRVAVLNSGELQVAKMNSTTRSP